MAHELGTRAADEPVRPHDLGIVVERRGCHASPQRLQRQERGRSRAFALEVGQGGSALLETVDDHPLETVSQHGFHGGLEARGHVQEIGHGADDSRHRGRPVPREEGAHPRAIALTLPLEAKEGLERGFLGREAHAQEGEGLLRLRPQPLLSLKLLVDLLSLSCEERKLRARLLEARFEPVPRGGQDIGLGARGRRLGLEPLAPPLDLRQALAQLAGRAGHLGPLSRRPDLLEAQAFQGLASPAEFPPARLEIRLERAHLPLPLAEALARLPQSADRLLALHADGGAPLAEGPHLLGESHLLLAELADLRAHLLAALEETLELTLELLRRLAQVGEPVVAFLDSGAQRRLA